MKKINLIIINILFISLESSFAQTPAPALIGYWQNWDDAQCPYITLTQIDTSYNIIPVAFAVPVSGTTYNMTFIPDGITSITLKKQIDTMHLRGKKVIISIGGANDPVILNDTIERNTFISSMMTIINTYGFDGIDIDLEGTSVSVSGGTITNPVDAKIINLIYAIREIMDLYRVQFGRKMFLTFAPETAYVQGGMSAYGGIWGAYLPVLNALRDSIEVLHVQLYNSGSMFGIDGNIYAQGTADFILSQTEAVIHGFNTAGGYFNGLRADQVAVGLPACSMAAGGGYIVPDSVKAAINYLRGLAPKPARYTKVSSYPTLRGMMDWSINWDKVGTCGGVYEYANSFNNIFRTSQSIFLSGFIQGFYDANTNTTIRDTIVVYLRNASSPFAIVDSAKSKLDSNGTAIFNFSNAANGVSYYIQLKHRNSIETWSATAQSFTNSLLIYNFSTAISQAFGNNLKQVDASPVRFAIYSGDVNQDGYVDVLDLGLVYNDVQNSVSGYVNTDLTGDDFVDVIDQGIVYNNSLNSVGVRNPIVGDASLNVKRQK